MLTRPVLLYTVATGFERLRLVVGKYRSVEVDDGFPVQRRVVPDGGPDRGQGVALEARGVSEHGQHLVGAAAEDHVVQSLPDAGGILDDHVRRVPADLRHTAVEADLAAAVGRQVFVDPAGSMIQRGTGVARSLSKNSRFPANSEAGMSNMLVASTKLTLIGFGIRYLNASEKRRRLSSARMLVQSNGLTALTSFERDLVSQPILFRRL